jgi:hypothetical protein
MSKEFLNRSDVIAAFEKMRGKVMPEGMGVRCVGVYILHNQYVWIADAPLSHSGKLILNCKGFLTKLLQHAYEVKEIQQETV